MISLADHQLPCQQGILSAYRDVHGQAWLEELWFRAWQVATELQRECAHADHKLALYTSDWSRIDSLLHHLLGPISCSNAWDKVESGLDMSARPRSCRDGWPRRFYLRHVELVENLGAEFDTVLMFRLNHSEETEINDQSRVECGGNISVRKRIAVDLVCC